MAQIEIKAYIRPDQSAWLEQEAARRQLSAGGRKPRRNEIIKEAIDTLIKQAAAEEASKS